MVLVNDNISDFLKEAYKHNKIRNLSEAFSEYPPELEWHKGQIENVIHEKEVIYDSNYKIGDIVFVNEYFYITGDRGKNHLFVIIDQDNLAVPIENFGMLISSNLNKLKYNSNVLLKRNENNNLNKDSIVKTDIMYRILNENILFKIGEVDRVKVLEYKRCFMDSLK